MYVEFKHNILLNEISNCSAIILNFSSLWREGFTYLKRFWTFKIESLASFQTLPAIRLKVWMTHPTWITSLPWIISSFDVVFHYHRFIAMSFALVLSTIMQRNFFISQYFIQSSNLSIFHTIIQLLFNRNCLSSIIRLCKVYLLSIQWLVI